MNGEEMKKLTGKTMPVEMEGMSKQPIAVYVELSRIPPKG